MTNYEVKRSICEKVLQEYYQNIKYDIIEYDLIPFSDEINGYLGVYQCLNVRVRPENCSELKLKFFVKHIKITNEIMIKSRNIIDLFEKEKFFYTEFLNEINKFVDNFDMSVIPKCYYVENGILILEDLTTSGFDLAKSLKFDKEHVKVALKSLAKLHASSFALEEWKSKKIGRPWRMNETFKSIMEEGFFRREESYWGHIFLEETFRAFDLIAEIYFENKDDYTSTVDWLKNYKAKLYSILNDKNNFRNVCTHGDFWAKNMLFKYNGDNPVDCKIIDFQLQKYAPPAHDVTFLIVHTTSKEIRLKYYQSFLDYYYECLNEELLKFGLDLDVILSKDEFEKTCKIYKTLAKVIRLAYSTISMVSQKNQAKYYDGDSYYNYLFYERHKLINSLFHTDKEYRSALIDGLETIYEDIKYDIVSIEDIYCITKKAIRSSKFFIQNMCIVKDKYNERLSKNGLKLYLDIQHNDRLKILNYFVRIHPSVEEHKMFTKIIPFLQNKVKIIKECIPNFYLSKCDDIIIFEDFATKGYKRLNSKIEFNINYVFAVIKTMVKFHATSFIFENKKSKTNYSLLNEFKIELEEVEKVTNEEIEVCKQLIKIAFQLFFPNSSAYELEDIEKKCNFLAENSISILKKSEPCSKVICHGDLCRENLMFLLNKEEVKDCRFIEFHYYKYAPPAFDFINFLYCSTDNNLRKKYFDVLVQFYYSQMELVLKLHGIKFEETIPFKEFVESCDIYKSIAIWQTYLKMVRCLICYGRSNESVKRDNETNEETTRVESDFLRKICKEDTHFKDRLHAAILDIKKL